MACSKSVPMSGYLGLFDTCMIEFVQIWVSIDLGMFVFLVFGENVVLFVWFGFGYLACSCSGFFVCLYLKRNSGFVGLLLIELVTGLRVYFFGLFMVWFGFFGFDKD